MEEEHNEIPPEAEEEVRASLGNLLDSRTSHLDDQLLEALEEAFYRQDPRTVLHDLAKIAANHNPVDLGFAVTRLPTDARRIVYQNLPDLNDKVEFLVNTDTNTRLSVFRGMPDSELVELINETPTDEAAEFLDSLPDRRLRRVLDRLDLAVGDRIRELLKHDRYSAGRLMTNEFFAFLSDTTIGEVASSIRDNPSIELTRRVFVLNKEGEIQGFVHSRNLIISHPNTPLRQVMQPVMHQVGPDATREEVVDLVERYKIPALPVVEEGGTLLGVVTYEDVVEVLEDIADETIGKMAGTSEDVSEHDAIFKRFTKRAPWLIVTLFSGLAIATALEFFANSTWFLFVPFFVPLVTGISGNVGIQCSTVLVRSMATGELSMGTRTDAMIRECTLGGVIGIIFAVCAGTLVYLLNHLGIHEVGPNPIIVGTIVGSGVFGACLLSTLLGVFAPFIFSRIGIDPAIASGPIVTALNDFSSTLIYCLIAFVATSLLL